MKKITIEPENELERECIDWINERAGEYDEPRVEGVLEDMAHGCSSGIVGHLIYTTDCVAFYEKHHETIDPMLADFCTDTGSTPAQLFEQAGWEPEDPLARGDHNRNILAWFGWEETCRNVGQRAGIEL